MNNEINKLIELQKKDIVIQGIVKKKNNIPVLIKGLNDKLAGFSQKLTEDKQNFEQNQVARKELELELGSIEESIKKHQRELNSVKTNDAYQALIREIADDKNQKDELETKILENMDKQESINSVLGADNKDMETVKKNTQDEISNLEEELNKISAELGQLNKDRETIAEAIPKKMLTLYDRIRISKGGVAIVEVINGCCNGCHMALAPQNIDDVIKNKDIVVCGICNRILYVKDENIESLKNDPTLKG
ncbi:MAG: C4-type zinc ribbon domain-containing protein [Elusimicrobiota bacterium]